MRRIAAQSPAVARARHYFYAGGGETGIWGHSMKRAWNVLWCCIGVGALGIWNLTFVRHGTQRQFVEEATDLFESDGTVMEGEEAVANVKIMYDRISPFMEEYKRQIEEASA